MKININLFFFEEGYLEAKSLMHTFGKYGIIMRAKDIEDLLDLSDGTLEIEDKVVPLIRLKSQAED